MTKKFCRSQDRTAAPPHLHQGRVRRRPRAGGAGDHHPPRLCRRRADRGQLDPLAVEPLPRHLEEGRRGLRQVGGRRGRDAGDRRQQREGHRRHQGDPRQDRRQLRDQRRPQRQPGRAADRRGLPGRRRLRRHPVEQARRPASLGPRPELRLAHLLLRRALRQGDGRGADQGDGRQGRHRRARRHRVRTCRRSSARPA